MPGKRYVPAAVAACAAAVLLLCVSFALARTSSHVEAATAHRIVAAAQRELARHVHEVPDGSNNARAITRYRSATVGAIRGAPWCAYFVSYIAKTAGVPLGWHGEGMGYVPYIRDWAHKTGRWSRTPKPGYLITFPQHVGIVEHVYANRTLTTIEGNTSNAVLRRFHRWGEATGYVKLAAGGSVETPATPPPPATTVVSQKLVARIKVYPANTAAVGQQLDFSAHDSSGPVVKYRWDFDGDGKWDGATADASHAWSQPGTYLVKLQVSDAQHHTKRATAKVVVHANQPPSASLSLSSGSVHVGDQVRMDSSRSSDADGRVTRYEWDYTGDGQFEIGSSHATHTYTEAGTYMVRVRVTDDSGNTAETDSPLTVSAYPGPAAAVSCDTTNVTSGQTVRCTSDDSGSPFRVARHDWDIQSDGSYDLHGTSVSFRYSHPGSYTVRLLVTDSHGNTATTDFAVRVANLPPRARITPPSVLNTNLPLTFDGGASSDSDGTVTTYEWDTGSGYEAGQKTLTTTFSTSGAHTVRLRVTDDSGQSAETSYAFSLANGAPVARIALPATAAINTQLGFDGSTSTDADGTIARYDWDLNGDGAYETTGAAPTFSYAATGQYTVKLKVTDNLGTTATITARLTVRDPANVAPVARLTVPLNAYTGVSASFSAAGSTDTDGTIKSYAWDFDGDGVIDRTTTTPSTTRVFTAPGLFEVSVTVVDDKWSQSTATASVRVN